MESSNESSPQPEQSYNNGQFRLGKATQHQWPDLQALLRENQNLPALHVSELLQVAENYLIDCEAEVNGLPMSQIMKLLVKESLRWRNHKEALRQLKGRMPLLELLDAGFDGLSDIFQEAPKLNSATLYHTATNPANVRLPWNQLLTLKMISRSIEDDGTLSPACRLGHDRAS
ncbi:hypothetical protein C8J56DRAFT_1089343 [Mycena floridula]|nr:hypothetical protein C8J56DRAFT_1089343 [Mycena floridula]